MLESLTTLIIHLINSLGYVGVFVIMALNSMFLPIPSEITLPFAGFLSNQGSLSIILVVITAVIGDLVGATFGYLIGFYLEETLVINAIKKYGKLVLLTEHDYVKATTWLRKWGSPVVFFAKLIPGLKSFISLASGLAEINFPRFLISSFLGSVVYVSLLTYFGYYLGSKWGVLGGYFRKFEVVIVLVLVLGLLWYINHKLKLIKLPKLH